MKRRSGSVPVGASSAQLCRLVGSGSFTSSPFTSLSDARGRDDLLVMAYDAASAEMVAALLDAES